MRGEIKISHVTDTVSYYWKVEAHDFYVMQFTLTKLITVYVLIGTRHKECLRKSVRSAVDLDATAIGT